MITRRTLFTLAAAGVVATAAGLSLNSTASTAAETYQFDWTAFDMARASGAPVLVDISASWCSTCRRQHNVYSKLVSEPAYSDYKIFLIDYDTQKDVMRKFNARQRSTLIVFKGSNEAGRVVGDTSKDSIETLLRKGV